MSDAEYRLLLLGPPSLTPTDPSHKALPPGKPLAVLAYLACAPGRSASREQLIDLLWSDAERDSARHTLRQTLWYARRRLGRSPFETSGDTVRLVLPVYCDRDAFLEAFDAGDWEAAFERYTGAFFPGFAAAGGVHFEQWADLERARLQSLFERAAESHLKQALIEQPPREVIPLVRRARELAPDSQAVWRLLLQALLAASDRVGATAEADQLDQWLTREDVTPEPATRSVLKLVRNDSVRAANRDEDGLVAELVGRERELSLLLRQWEEAKAGTPSHAHITARAGVGKTRLLDDLARRLKASRARVVAVRALQANRELPFALAADLTLALAKLRGAAGISPDAASALVALAPGVSTYLSAAPDRTSGGDALRRRTLALQELVAMIADDAPIVMLVDDMHWSDVASRAMLASLSAGLRESHVLLVSAGRQTLPGGGEHVKHLPLEPLSDDQVSTLVESLAALPSEAVHAQWSRDFATQLHAAADGSPLLVLETLLLLLERGVLLRSDGSWHCPDPDALASILAGGSAIRQRLLNVPEEQRGTLILLAVFGNEMDDRAVRLALGEDGSAALPLLEVRGLIARMDGGWMVAHDEIAARIRELATAEQLIHAHRQSAVVLEAAESESPGALLRAARHRRDAGDQSELERLFTRLVRANVADGDRRAIRLLATDVLGPEASAAARNALERSLPWRVRTNMPQLFGVSLAAVAGLVLLVSAFVPERVVEAPPGDVALYVAAQVGNDTLMYKAELDYESLLRAREVEMQRVDMSPRAVSELAELEAVYARWGDTAVGITLDYGREAGLELVQVDLRTGERVRLTDAPTDDVTYSLSPDRTHAVFVSARADTVNEYGDLYIVSRADGSVERITQTSHWNGFPVWSPDGTRIAFFRRFSILREANAICIVVLASRNERCLPQPDDYDLLGNLTWDSNATLLVLAEPRLSVESLLLRVSVSTGAVEPVKLTPDRTLLDAGGEFGLSIQSAVGTGRQSASVFNLLSPTLDVTLTFPDEVTAPLFRSAVWQRRRAPELFRGTLAIVEPPETLRRDALHRLRVVARARDDRRTEPPLLHFSSLDSSVVRVSPVDGTLSPQDTGIATLVVEASGFRPDTVTVRIGPPRFGADVLVEQWDSLSAQRWTAYGVPAVRPVVSGDGRRALLMDGDGHLSSGLFLSESIDARAGIGVEVQLQAPVTSTHWQALSLALVAIATDAELAFWGADAGTERGEGQPKTWEDDAYSRACRLSLPRNEGGGNHEQVAFSAAGHPDRIKRLPMTLVDGAWHTVRLQIFADGRCGLAVDGAVITISERALPLDKPFRIDLLGQSVGARMLFGPLTLWQGERLDLPWFSTPDQLPPRASVPGDLMAPQGTGALGARPRED